MSDNRLKIAIAASLAVHLGLLGLIGSTSAARQIDVDQLRILKVDLVQDPDQSPDVQPVPPKADMTPEPKPPPETRIAPVREMRTQIDPPRSPQPRHNRQPPPGTAEKPGRTGSGRPAGDPGGAIDMGTPSPKGEDLGRAENGRTPSGWVPSPTGGQGAGSGTGAGVGRPDPVPEATPGPGIEPAPPPVYVPPPPKMVEVVICALSGDKPNPNCKNKRTRSYVEGREPRGTCEKCKPEPKHQSRTAAVVEAERIKDAPVDIPESVRESGINTRVTVTYTVGTDGKVSDVQVTESSGNQALNRAVIAAALKMKYKPAMQDGVPRSIKMRRTYHIRC